jgi:L-threonylcarbamoyladenylate synthase
LNEQDQYRKAREVLREGGVVALPTDTVYGLCAVATDDGAVRRLFDIKQRLSGQSLPVFVGSIEQAALIAEMAATARVLADAFWPGPLTIVARRSPEFRTLAAAGETIGVRVPDDAVLRELATQLGPLTGTSANLSGMPEAHSAEEVRDQLGESVDLIVDASAPAGGVPSTVVDCTDERTVRVLREGGVSHDELRAALAGIAEIA